LPCFLLGSMGSSLNPATLRDSWQMVAGGALSTILSNATASLFGRLLMRQKAQPMFRPAQVAIAFPDSLFFPLLLLGPLCKQSIIVRCGHVNWFAL